jgi:hypothetical protein
VRLAMCRKVSDKKFDFQMIDFNYVLLSLSHPYLKIYNLQNEGPEYPDINQSVYFIFQKSITRHMPYGHRNGQKIYIQVIEVICTTSNVTHLYKNILINKLNK